jgi:hypothetical protein
VCDAERYEARALLDRVAESVATARERETLGWLVREHNGEQLAEIAEEAGIPAPAVRQRVSRLRRLLRARWSHALAFLLVAGSCGALARHAMIPDTIVAEPIGRQPPRATGLPQGVWRIDRVLTDPGVATKLAPAVRVRVDGAHITLSAAAQSTERDVIEMKRSPDGSFELTVQDASGRIEHASLRPDGDGFVITLEDGVLRGSARVVRE